jgi:hypothetical protein
MRQSSKLGIGIVALVAGWALVTSVEGQQPLGLQPSTQPAVKKGHLITAGVKEYEMLADYPEIEGQFRSFDPDKSIIKVRIEYEHADKEHKDEFDRAQKTYRDQQKSFHERYNNLQNDYRNAMGTRNPQDKNNRLNGYKNGMDSLGNDKRNSDQQYKDALKNMGMIRDYIDYEFIVEKDAPIRKLWAPKLFDDKGRPRTQSSFTKEETLKYKGPDSKMVGWIAKLETFEVKTPVKLKIRQASMKELEPEPEPVNSTTPTTPPPAPNPAKEDPAKAPVQAMKLEDRPVVKMVIAESDPNVTATPASTPGIKTK